MKILQFSHPRTGSTIIWYILDYLFSNPHTNNDRWKTPLNVKKTHQINLFKKYSKQKTHFDWCVITIRDPYQTAISVLRSTQKGDFNKIETIQQFKPQIINQFKLINKSYTTIFNTLNNNNKKFMLLDYRDIDDIEKILYFFEKGFSVDIPDKQNLVIKFSKDSMLEISNKYKSFATYDKKTLIHGNHINNQSYYPQILKTHPEYKNVMNVYNKLQTYIEK